MNKLQLTEQNLGRVFNSRCGCVHNMQLNSFETKLSNIKLKTWPKQLLGHLPLYITHPGGPYLTWAGGSEQSPHEGCCLNTLGWLKLTRIDPSTQMERIDGWSSLPLDLRVLGLKGDGSVLVQVDLDEFAGGLDADPHLAVVRSGRFRLWVRGIMSFSCWFRTLKMRISSRVLNQLRYRCCPPVYNTSSLKVFMASLFNWFCVSLFNVFWRFYSGKWKSTSKSTERTK